MTGRRSGDAGLPAAGGSGGRYGRGVGGGESVAFDRVAGTYDETRGGMERGRSVGAVLAGLLPADGPLLEVGVGTGLISAGLTERGRRPVGIDLSLPMLAVARTRLPGRLAGGDAQRLPVRTGSVAGLCLVHVLHLVGDVAATLAECARVLRPGGTMVTTALPDGGRDDLRDELERIRTELGSTLRQDEEPVIVRRAAEAGFALVARADQEGRRATPRFTAELMAARSLSWMWAVDDALWTRALPSALARLRALPDQDRVRPGPGTTILAFHHP